MFVLVSPPLPWSQGCPCTHSKKWSVENDEVLSHGESNGCQQPDIGEWPHHQQTLVLT